MNKYNELSFNPKNPTIIHVDINSCFATIEQQANPQLRGKNMVVAAYKTDNGCILAASIEAKRFGIKTGMRVRDAKLIDPKIIVLEPDPNKYRDVHLKIREIVKSYTKDFAPKSIDEFVLNLEGYPALKNGIVETARELKQRIRTEVGEWISVSAGIGPNRFLAKTAAGLKKPDGLEIIDIKNHLEVYKNLELTKICGIKSRSAARLATAGIYTTLDLYKASVSKLESAFHSITGYYWYLRLKGWEIDDIATPRKSFGNSYCLPRYAKNIEEAAPILFKLVEKTAFRLRHAGYKAKGMHVYVRHGDGTSWHHGKTCEKPLFDERDIFKEMFRILSKCPENKPISMIAETCFWLVPGNITQLDLFEDVNEKIELNKALDEIKNKWGEYALIPATLIKATKDVHDRISFGGVREL